METNGRPARVELMTPGASPGEAAAVIAAIEQFLAETAPSPQTTVEISPWQRAALLEGHRAKRAMVDAWGDRTRWGA